VRRKSEVRSQKSEVGKKMFLHFRLPTSYFLLCAATALAADPPLYVEPAPSSPNVRLGKPMPTVWDVLKRQPGLMEGRLEFRVHLEGDEFYTYVTDELVLHAPEQRLRFLFPAVTQAVQTPELEVDIAWLGKSGRVPLKMQLIRLPFTAQKSMLMAVGEERSGHGRPADWDARLESLKVESLATEPVRQRLAGRESFLPLQTVVHSWDANLFPPEPLAYLAYDAVAIHGVVFRQLRRQQLEALETWVRAGGKLYVEPDGLLEAVHVDFLNRLTAAEQPPVRWSLDRVGRLDWPVLNRDDEYRAFVDLGRLIVRRPETPHARWSADAVRFLWDVPPGVDPVHHIAEPELRPRSRVPMNAPMGYRSPWIRDPDEPFNTLQLLLMPRGVQVVPVWLIALLLGGLVLAIGPGEWWLLGKLRMRRFTWLTWPAATIAITGLTVTLSNWFMASSEQSRFLQLHDLGSDGRIVRSQRFTLSFPGRTKSVTADVERSLWRVVEPPRQDLNAPGFVMQGNRRQVMMNGNAPSQEVSPTAKLPPPKFDGRVPNRYTATQTVGQWTPRISHEYRFPDDEQEPLPGVAFDQISPEVVGQTLWKRDAMKEWLPAGAIALVFDRSGSTVSSPNASAEHQAIIGLVDQLTLRRPNSSTQIWTAAADRFGWSELPIMSQMSPHAESALVVIVPESDGWTVYRKLYHRTPVRTHENHRGN
jgi:hypothetical protein